MSDNLVRDLYTALCAIPLIDPHSHIDPLIDAAQKAFAQPDWEKQVFAKSKLEAIFLTNEFDDSLDGFDTTKYVPCLRTDSLVFHLDKPKIRQRLADVTGVEVGDAQSLRKAVWKLFARFKAKGAKACAISLPPDFSPARIPDAELDRALKALAGD